MGKQQRRQIKGLNILSLFTSKQVKLLSVNADICHLKKNCQALAQMTTTEQIKSNTLFRGSARFAKGSTRGNANRDIKVLVDQVIPTNRTIKHRRSELVVRMERENMVIIFEVACAWGKSLVEREKEIRGKYHELAADLVTQERTITSTR